MNHSTLHAPVTLSASSDAAGGGASRPTPARLRRSASPLHHVAHVERAPVRRLLGQLLDQLSSQELSHVTHRPSGPCCWPRRFSSRSSQPRRHHRLPPHTSPATGTWPWRVRSRLSQASAMPKRARNSAASLCWEGWLASQLSPWRARSQVAPSSTSPKTPAAAAVTVQPSLLPSAASRRTVCGAGASTTQGPRHVARTTGSRSARTLHRFL